MERQSSQGSSERSESSLPIAQVSHRGIGSIVPADVDMGVQPSASVNVQSIQQKNYTMTKGILLWLLVPILKECWNMFIP